MRLPRAASTSLAAWRSCGLLAAAICCRSASVYGRPLGPGSGTGSAGSGGKGGIQPLDLPLLRRGLLGQLQPPGFGAGNLRRDVQVQSALSGDGLLDGGASSHATAHTSVVRAGLSRFSRARRKECPRKWDCPFSRLRRKGPVGRRGRGGQRRRQCRRGGRLQIVWTAGNRERRSDRLARASHRRSRPVVRPRLQIVRIASRRHPSKDP